MGNDAETFILGTPPFRRSDPFEWPKVKAEISPARKVFLALFAVGVAGVGLAIGLSMSLSHKPSPNSLTSDELIGGTVAAP
jgi:hypothetical protein